MNAKGCMQAVCRALVCLWLCLGYAAAASACAPPGVGYTPELAPKGQSGTALRFAWSDPWPKVEGCPGHRFLVLALPPSSRVEGAGALVLGQNERAPQGIAWRKSDLRVFIPIDNPRSFDGQIGVVPYLIGTFELDWALVYRTGNRAESVLAEGTLRSTVRPGRPEVLVFDTADTARPDRVITSNSGTFRIEDFSGHFRVIDTATGVPVYAGEGVRPGFSPGARFVHAFRTETGTDAEDLSPFMLFADLDVIDLFAGVPVLTLRSFGYAARGDFITGLLWSPQDSFLVILSETAGGMAMKPMLTDGAFWGGQYSCGGCSPWTEGVVMIDADHGYAFLGAGHSSQAVSLYYPEVAPGVDPALMARVGPIEVPAPLRDMLGPPLASYLAADRDDIVDVTLVVQETTAGDDLVATGADLPDTGRAAVALPDETFTLRGDARMADRLADLGLIARPAPGLEFESVPSERWRAIEADEEVTDKEPDHWMVEGGYYFDTGRAAVAAGLATADEATRLTALAISAMDTEICRISRANHADVWSFRGVDGAMIQLLHVYCRVGTGYETEGFLSLLRLDGPQDRIALVALASEYGTEAAAAGSILPLGTLAAQVALRVDRLESDLLAIAGTDGTVVLIDAGSATVRQIVTGLPAPDQIARLSLTLTGGHLLQEQKDGQFHVFSAKDGARLLSGYYLDDEVIVLDPSFRFDATPEGAGYFWLRFPGETALYTLPQLGSGLQTPGLMDVVLGSGVAGAESLLPDVLPPRLILTEKGLSDGKLSLRAEAAGGLAVIEVFRDGVRIAERRVSGPEAELSVAVDLLPETRWISARATDVSGLTSALLLLPVTAGSGTPKGRLHVLAVGIDEFQDPRLPDLSFAITDAQRFAAAAATRAKGQHLYAAVTVETVSPAAALRSALPERIDALAARMRPDDTLMVFLATHGVIGASGTVDEGTLYLTDSQTRMEALAGTALSMQNLKRALEAVSARTVVFVDACHSGAPGTATNEEIQARLVDEDTSMAIIAASKGRQQSLEGARLGGGAFTTAVVRALGDGGTDLDDNGVIELSELYLAVKREVVLATDGRQTPWIARSGFVGEVPLF